MLHIVYLLCLCFSTGEANAQSEGQSGLLFAPARPGTVENGGLSLVPVFMRHAPSAGAWRVRRLIGWQEWAWAGHIGVATQRWEFEAGNRSLDGPLEMADSRDRSTGGGRSPSDFEEEAITLIENLRRSPLSRGRIPERKEGLFGPVFRAIEAEGVPTKLAFRVAYQLLRKFELRDLGGVATWRGIGKLLRSEVDRLVSHLGFTERQTVVLGKLSALQVEALYQELRAMDRKVARTILNAAIGAADPMAAARACAAEFFRVVVELKSIDVRIARTVASAVVNARDPGRRAQDFVQRFAELLMAFRDDVRIARTVAIKAFRSPDPLKRARRCISDYNTIVADLTAANLEAAIARTLATAAIQRSNPTQAAQDLVRKFKCAFDVAQPTHPNVARSIASRACVSKDPERTALRYMKNYDAAVRLISETDPERAHEVAVQTFQFDHPSRWIRRHEMLLRKHAIKRDMKALILPALLSTHWFTHKAGDVDGAWLLMGPAAIGRWGQRRLIASAA
jgi:hypothetical protein